MHSNFLVYSILRTLSISFFDNPGSKHSVENSVGKRNDVDNVNLKMVL